MPNSRDFLIPLPHPLDTVTVSNKKTTNIVLLLFLERKVTHDSLSQYLVG